jgi:hypothetical protein
LAAELGSKHAKRISIVLGMLEDGLDTTKVGPLLIFPNHADQVIDRGGAVGNHR